MSAFLALGARIKTFVDASVTALAGARATILHTLLVKRTPTRWTLTGAVGCAMALTFVGCGFLGFGPDYPMELPLPPSASEVVSDTGSDEDEPMRSRQQVLDIPNASASELLNFYQGIFPEARGWSTEATSEGQMVCLSRESDEGYFEFVEVFPYEGSRVDVRPDRFLATASRFQDESHCGSALAWVPLDLIE